MATHKKADKNVLFMLDEFPILGRMSCIETAIGLARGYGIQIWMFLQDIHQLNYLYKDKAESFLANTGMQQYFIPNDIITAERISRRMGNTTLIDEKITRDLHAAWNTSPANVEISHKERPLNYPIEILAFDKNIQLIFFSGNANVVVMAKNYYYDDGNYTDNGKKLYDKNPYYDEDD
jgi:type IV secretion system protein VirD4